mmetsp:Transcript_1766/g.4423  ORF Transcript_1766/g.4423 Transcript_1766/m.4423 type:complete len:549 (+) Transcript_1766:200-1846(+)
MVGATAQNHGPSVLVSKFVRVLPNIADEIANAKGRVSAWCVCCDWLRPVVGVTARTRWEIGHVLVLAPWVLTTVQALRGVLPLVSMWQSRASGTPRTIFSRLVERYVRYWSVTDRSARLRGASPMLEPSSTILRAVACCFQVPRVVGVRRGVLVNIERRKRKRVCVFFLRVRFPWELHVDAVRVVAFNFQPCALECEVVHRGNEDHTSRRCSSSRGPRNGDDGLRQVLPLGREVLQRDPCERLHHQQEAVQHGAGFATHTQHAPIPIDLERDGDRLPSVLSRRMQLYAMVTVEVPRRLRRIIRDEDPSVRKALPCSVDEGVQRVAAVGKAGREDALVEGIGHMRLPLRRLQQPSRPSEETEHRRHPPDRLGVARHDPIPRAPHVLPRLVPCAVEPRRLQVVRLALGPPVTHVRHELAAREELEPVDRRRMGVRPVPPPQSLPVERRVGAPNLRLQRQRVAHVDRSLPESLGHKVHRVAVETVAPRSLEQRGDGVRFIQRFLPRPLIPRVVRPEHTDARGLEARSQPRDGVEPARHRAEAVELVACVDP